MNRGAVGRTIAGFVLAGVVFVILFSFVDAGAVVAALGRADLRLIAVAAVLYLCWNVCWGLSLWQILAAQNLDVTKWNAVLFNAAAGFANHITPLGQIGGEPVTAWIITRSSDTDYEVSLASIASYDALHVLPSLSFAAVGAMAILATGTVPESSLGMLAVGTVGLAVGVPLLGYGAWYHRRPIGRRLAGTLNRVVRGLLSLWPGAAAPAFDAVETRLAGFAAAIERIGTDRQRLGVALGFSSLGWLCQALGLWVALLALSIQVPPHVPLIAVPLGATGGGIPTPGGLGGTEAVYVATLTLLTAADTVSITAAVTIHATGGYLLTTSVGAAAIGALELRTRSLPYR